MVYFVLTRKGYSELKPEFSNLDKSFWVSGKVLSKPEIEEHRKNNVNLTVFNDEIEAGNADQIQDSLHDIAQHHPGETIWMEREIAL